MSDSHVRCLEILDTLNNNRDMVLISAGTDRRIRYWNSSDMKKSKLIVPGCGEIEVPNGLQCESKMDNGARTIVETNIPCRDIHGSDSATGSFRSHASSDPNDLRSTGWLRSWSTPSLTGTLGSFEGIKRNLYDPDVHGHFDVINGLTTVYTGSQPFLVSASRSGVVKVWS